MKNKNIIIVGLQDWDTNIGSNCKDIALEFARNNRVLYVNYPLDRKTLLTQYRSEVVHRRLRNKNSENGLYKIGENIWGLYPDTIIESINLFKNNRIFDFLNYKNNIKFAGAIKKACSVLNFTDFVLFNDNDIFRSFYLKELLNPTLSIYYIRDFLPGVEYWKHHGTRLEPALIAKSDIVVTNSLYLTDYAAQFNSFSSFVGQGCDFSFLEQTNHSIPQELSHIHTPVIGYVGAIASHRLDLKLLEFLARNNPGFTFVFVGPEDEHFSKSLLHQQKNVVFTGSKLAGELANYIRRFDVCINPQQLNAVTIGNYPRKVDEYLALGKPVVATETPAMQFFDGFVYLANGNQDFSNKISRALNENNLQLATARENFAIRHTWEESVTKIYSAIKNKENNYAVSVA